MTCSWFWNLPNTQHFSFCAPESDVLTTTVKKTKTLRGRENILGKTSALTVTVGRAGQSGCRDASHPACCFLTVYLGSTLARRKSWQPRPAGITTISFLNVFKYFSWIPRSGCSLELHDSVKLCVCLCSFGI